MYFLSIGVVGDQDGRQNKKCFCNPLGPSTLFCYGSNRIHVRREYYAYGMTNNSIFGEVSNGGTTLCPAWLWNDNPLLLLKLS